MVLAFEFVVAGKFWDGVEDLASKWMLNPPTIFKVISLLTLTSWRLISHRILYLHKRWYNITFIDRYAYFWPEKTRQCSHLDTLRLIPFFKLTDAVPGPSTERNVRIRMPFHNLFGQKVVRIEFLGVLPKGWVLVCAKDDHRYGCSFWNGASSYNCIVNVLLRWSASQNLTSQTRPYHKRNGFRGSSFGVNCNSNLMDFFFQTLKWYMKIIHYFLFVRK